MTTEAFKDVPESFENEVRESIDARTAALPIFNDLGSPDLVQITKQQSRSATKEIGSYHFVTGVDASSSASLAAYMNNLTYSMGSTQTWLGGKSRLDWKVTQAVYCCFNAFSHVDVRVEVKIPGTVEAYVVDSRGERHQATPQIWTELYLSAILRAIHYADDNQYRLVACRKLDPLKSVEEVDRFLRAAEQLFHLGPQLGSENEVQVSTLAVNNLTAGVMKFFKGLGRWELAVNFFEKIYSRHPEAASLLAEAYIEMNEEVKAVQILHSGLEADPLSYNLLLVQCEFLRSKGKLEWALQLAQRAVNSAPSEFNTWAKLTEMNIETKRYDDALRSLNSCPMYGLSNRELHMPMAARMSFPVKQHIAESNILDEDSSHDSEADTNLLRLTASQLRGTNAKAYTLLARLASLIGWDELLKCRSKVFVMEEEYRMYKMQESKAVQSIVNGIDSKSATGSMSSRRGSQATPDKRSNTALDEGNNNVEAGMEKLSVDDKSPGIPTIKVSAESDDEGTTEEGREERSEAAANEEEETSKASANDPTPESIIPEHKEPTEPTRASLDGSIVVRPGADDDQTDDEEHDNVSQDGTVVPNVQEQQQNRQSNSQTVSFVNKRLCERWLDHLFTELYEDLRIYTIWRAELAARKAERVPYQRSGADWEILGDLAQRLQHKEEAKDAYQRCFALKFSSKAWLKLLEYYSDEGDVQRSLYAAAHLAAHQHRWYYEASYPSLLATNLFKLVRLEGISKVNSYLTSLDLPPSINKIMQDYLQVATAFKIEGSEF